MCDAGLSYIHDTQVGCTVAYIDISFPHNLHYFSQGLG